MVQNGTQINNAVLYTGRYYDAVTGNYFYRARYYSPYLGRFISRDPLSGAEFSQGTNLYAYVENNYTDLDDPTGMDALSDGATQHFVNQGFPRWAATGIVATGSFAINHQQGLEATRTGLDRGMMVLGVGAIVEKGAAMLAEAGLKKAAEGGAGGLSKVEQIVKDIEDSGATIKQNPLKPNQEGNITIDMGSQGRINVRVETYPLEPGGPPVPHANVESVIESGGQKTVTNTHITN